MIISDLEYLEQVSEASEIVGSAGLILNLDKLIDSLTNDIIKEANKLVKQAKAKPKAAGKNVVVVATANVKSSKPGTVTVVASVTTN